jgi:hypothetical protein
MGSFLSRMAENGFYQSRNGINYQVESESGGENFGSGSDKKVWIHNWIHLDPPINSKYI